MRVRTEADFPKQWADTQFNLGLALREANDPVAEREYIAAAVRGYTTVGLDDDANEAARFVTEIDAGLEDAQVP